jgi:hypothetical protein
MAANQSTDIPTVPIRTPMFDGDGFTDTNGNLDRVWISFFESLRRLTPGDSATSTGGGPYQRTLLLKDTTVNNDVADHVTVYGPVPGTEHTIIAVTGVLRKAITAPLTVRINCVSKGKTAVVVGTFTIPAATPADKIKHFPVTTLTTKVLPVASVLTWDITASDGSRDPAGVASFTVEWT